MTAPQPLSVLVATDFSEDAGHAVARAAMLAAGLPARLSLLHVVSAPMLGALRAMFGGSDRQDTEGRMIEETRQSLRSLATMLGNLDGEIACEVRVGKIVDEVLAAAAQHDLLVLGPRGSNPLRDLILGTTAERILAKSTRPILVARQPAREPYRQVAVAMDFSPDSVAALRAAARLAPGAELAAVHAFDLPFEGKLLAAGIRDDEIQHYRAQARLDAMRGIERAAVEAGLDPMRISRVVQQGHAGRTVLEQAEHLGADLIVLGKHGESGLEEMMLGSVTRHVLSDARCDVLVARREQ
ncbi:universal stress protein [Quisquiliibacterium transsilvanicum]|uniref:Nucleotide-binding universal stress UspA family protein n=1 Tax=Quisquiliibacterium transsilvanicum TaxID=1549638 RepID=A0A7W8HKK5_9BURK|nr:universal stress protein [Quisquiliibacterium transsilvanicum]MBB5273577.1 nucleotide-binding universal stress UspA family protein [Quisquiliibacterium transsilvanicum]